MEHTNAIDTLRSRTFEKIRREAGPRFLAALEDPGCIEIRLNPNGNLALIQLGGNANSAGIFEANRASSLIATVANATGRGVSTREPILECEFPLDGSRFVAVIPPVVRAPIFVLRKHSSSVLSLDSYEKSGAMSPSFKAAIAAAVKAKKNILVAGSTGSGKTTLTNAILGEISQVAPDDRLVVIEDTPELKVSSRDSVLLRTDEGVGIVRALRTTMRLSPDRIVVGEVRGEEALTLLKAWNTGHPGGVATIHSGTVIGALVRLEQLVSEAIERPMQTLIAEAIDLVVVIGKTPLGRRVIEVAHVLGHENGEYAVSHINDEG